MAMERMANENSSASFASDSGAPRKLFATTHWSVILAAQDAASPAAHDALAQLCSTYWFPLYVFIRREGHNAEDAQDLTQEFFARFLARDDLRAVKSGKGKFRSFLLASVKHFLANAWDHAHAAKRSGQRFCVPWDDEMAERHYSSAVPPNLSSEEAYERQRTLAMLERVLVRLRDEYAAAGKDSLFDGIQGYLSATQSPGTYVEVAERLGLSENAIRVAVHRLRRRYGRMLRSEVAHTVASVEDIDAELRHLFDIIHR
jgi:RNA polymerase sigma factor (sigma-70 family)